MANMLDYIKENGNTAFQEEKFNEIDNLIFSRLSYLPFEEIKIEEKETFEIIAQKLQDIDIKKFNMKKDKELIKLVGKSNRYKDLLVTDYYFSRDDKKEKQFVAITIHLENEEMYISYGGTDDTLVGWKEDFNLSFMTNIPAQSEALKYIRRVSKKYNSKIHLGGHSKGGNLAVYAGIFCSKKVQDRIIDITNFDGPGFDKTVIEKEKYKRVLNKINTFIPQSSLFGRLLEHEEKYIIVTSDQYTLMQHDIFSWRINNHQIEKANKVTAGSDFMNETVRNWLKTTSPKQREHFINTLYEIITKTKAKTFKEFTAEWTKNVGIILKSYKDISNEDKKEIGKMILTFFTAVKDTIMEKVI